jgi:hypothetical protein
MRSAAGRSAGRTDLSLRTRLRRLERYTVDAGFAACRDRCGPIVFLTAERRPDGTVVSVEDCAPQPVTAAERGAFTAAVAPAEREARRAQGYAADAALDRTAQAAVHRVALSEVLLTLGLLRLLP